jgi:hypothetical protein
MQELQEFRSSGRIRSSEVELYLLSDGISDSATPEHFCALKPHDLCTPNIRIREDRFNDRFVGHGIEV